ncbi:MAG TPA: hypothetical protein VM638_00190 [Actinomycetota bacterium]|nr:hypothetical protein [Actinomycetota bacterium]
MDLDLELAHRESRTRFDVRLAALVGSAAIAAALLGTLEMHSGKREERAFTMASRLAVQVSSGTAVSGLRSSLQASAITQGAAGGLESAGRAIAAIEAGSPEGGAIAAAEERASERLLELAQALLEAPGPDTGLDARTRGALEATPETLTLLVAEQNRQVDLAERYGNRENAAIFGLSLVAIAAVLLGLAGILGEGRQGRMILTVATVVLGASVLWGGWALLR